MVDKINDTLERKQVASTKILTMRFVPTTPSAHYCNYIPDCGDFYRQPLPPNDVDGTIRYGKPPVGVNTLSKCVGDMMVCIGEEGYYTGHSIKVTCGTQLVEQGTDKQLIQHRTGQRSVSHGTPDFFSED